MPFPSTLEGRPKIIFFTDFDGTITLQDTNDYLTDHHGFGPELRRAGNLATLNGSTSFRTSFQSMLESWDLSFPECIPILEQNISLDPHFATFYDWAIAHAVPVIVLSSGLEPIIRALLKKLLGEEAGSAIEVIANVPVGKPPVDDLNVAGGWTIGYHDSSGFGHDKSLTIRPYAEAVEEMVKGREEHEQRPTLLYAGDGVSDLSAARETDLLFAKKGRDLVTYCQREGVPFTPFEDWSDILRKTKEIYEGRVDVRRVAEEGRQEEEEQRMGGSMDKVARTETVR